MRSFASFIWCFQMRHGRFDAGAPSVDFAKGLAALIKPALLIGGSLGVY
jgi:hypothetical protein